MCGIVAFFAQKPLATYRSQITELLRAANERGGHSYGFVLYDKQWRPISEVRTMGKGVAFAPAFASAYGIMYHSRFGTSAPLKPHFSQPIRTVHGYASHNGHVSVNETEEEHHHVGEAYRALDSQHLVHGIEDREPDYVKGLSGYGAVCYVPDAGEWIEVWSDSQAIHMSKSKGVLAVSSVPVPKIGFRWEMHKGGGKVANVTREGIDYDPSAIPLADGWGQWYQGRYGAMTSGKHSSAETTSRWVAGEASRETSRPGPSKAEIVEAQDSLEIETITLDDILEDYPGLSDDEAFRYRNI